MYGKFIERLLEVLRDRVDNRMELSVYTAVKNNGHERKGITFSEEGRNVSPTIYLEEYYERYRKGWSVEKIAEQVLEMHSKIVSNHNWGEKALYDYRDVKDRIIYKLVNQEKNRGLLAQVPHMKYLDLAALFYVLIDIDEPGGQMATMLVRNEHLAWWNVTAEEIQKQAEDNTERILPYEFNPMHMIIEEMMGIGEIDEEEWREFKEQESMYVLTNHIKSGGATAILYPERLEAIGAFFKENYYILPSSTHEVIVIPESRAIPIEEMKNVVMEVNETEVQAEEFLSNHIYYYDRKKKELGMA